MAKMISEKENAQEETKSLSPSLKESVINHGHNLKIAGIEGGGTRSLITVMDGFGHKLVHFVGPHTNHWAIGMKEVTARINAMIDRAKETLGISKSHPFDCVGLSLSGCEDQSSEQIVQMLHDEFPNASKDYIIGSDTIGSLKTMLDSGGIVLISGTGSNACLINSDRSIHTCGGWGHTLGDEGSAYWISHRACQYVINDIDNFKKAPHPISYIWPAMKTYFHINNTKEILPQFYTNFSKSSIAMFTKVLADGCVADDPLCKLLFTDAGRALAQHVLALYDKATYDIKFAKGGIKIACVGSVWKSWEFMEKGFIEEIDKGKIEELTLLRLKVPAAVGACYLAADKCKLDAFVKAYNENSEAFFHYRSNNLSTSGRSVVDIDIFYESNNITSIS